MSDTYVCSMAGPVCHEFCFPATLSLQEVPRLYLGTLAEGQLTCPRLYLEGIDLDICWGGLASTGSVDQDKSGLVKLSLSTTLGRLGDGSAVQEPTVEEQVAREPRLLHTACRPTRGGSSAGEKYSRSTLGGRPLVLSSTHMMCIISRKRSGLDSMKRTLASVPVQALMAHQIKL